MGLDADYKLPQGYRYYGLMKSMLPIREGGGGLLHKVILPKAVRLLFRRVIHTSLPLCFIHVRLLGAK